MKVYISEKLHALREFLVAEIPTITLKNPKEYERNISKPVQFCRPVNSLTSTISSYYLAQRNHYHHTDSMVQKAST